MRPKGRWTGVRPAEGREGYFEVWWSTHEPSNSKGVKKATHIAPDLWELFKTLGAYFEDQGKKYYTQDQLDEQVNVAVKSALSSAHITSVASPAVKEEFESLKTRVSELEVWMSMSKAVKPEAPSSALYDPKTDPRVIEHAYEIAPKFLALARLDKNRAFSDMTNKLRDDLGILDDDSPFSRKIYGIAKGILVAEMNKPAGAQV